MVSDRVCPERAIGFMAGVSICVRPGVRRVWARSTQLSVNRSSHKYEVGQRGLRGLEWRTSDTPSIPHGLYSAGGPPRWPCASNQGSGRNGPEAEGTLYELHVPHSPPPLSVCCAERGGSSETGNLPVRSIYRGGGGADGEQNWWPTSFWVWCEGGNRGEEEEMLRGARTLLSGPRAIRSWKHQLKR